MNADKRRTTRWEREESFFFFFIALKWSFNPTTADIYAFLHFDG